MIIEQRNPAAGSAFYVALILGVLASAVGIWDALHVAEHGLQLTNMNNQVFWGLPHVFGIFMIVAASGAVNVATIGTVFGKQAYLPRAPLSALLGIALLAGGLATIMLDLGRPDRLTVAMTNINLKSTFGRNSIIYPVFLLLAGLTIWVTMARGINKLFYQTVNLTTLFWRLIMTMGTGSIFGYIVARQAYQSAILPPLFIVMSLVWGMATFLIVQKILYTRHNIELHPQLRARFKNLLGIFIGTGMFFVLIYHLVATYYAKNLEYEYFILFSGGIFTWLFWGGYLVVGSILPLLLLYVPALSAIRGSVTTASLLAILGGLSLMYVIVISGQVYPMDMFPGAQVSSSFYDGMIDSYTPNLSEVLLSLGGVGIAFTVALVGLRVLDFVPRDDVAKLQSAGYLRD